MTLSHLETSLDRLLSEVTPSIGAILDRTLAEEELTIDEGTRLFEASGSDLLVITAVADHLRKKTVGDVVTFARAVRG